MSDLFERYEQDYQSISQSISKKINTPVSATQSVEQRKTTLRQAERELDEADEILQSMEMELSSLPPSIRTRLQPKLRQYRVDYEKLRADLKSASAKPSERDQLFGGLPTGREDVVSNDQRSRLLVGTNKLNDASRRLEDSHRIALETEEIGASTLETLRNQRQQILRATDTLDDANSYIDRNIRILRDMARRATTNKFLSIIIIIILVVVIILILALKFGG